MGIDLDAVRQAVAGAELSPDAQRIATWSIAQLPKLYQEFLQGYDSRFADEILRWVQALLKALDEKADVAKVVREHFVSMHEQLGLPSLALKAAPAPRAARLRKSA